MNYLKYVELMEEVRVHRHSTHIEDLSIIDGKNGIKKAVDSLIYVKDRFGTTDVNDQKVVSTKIDGSPAVIAGWVGKKFFVASKGLFNKTPKINYTSDDIDRNHGESAGLAKKLKFALKYLRKVIPTGKIYQGDFLFDATDRKSENIDGVPHWTWHPNTIKYAVEKNSPLGETIGRAKIGVVFHTKYTITGEDVSTITLDGFNVNVGDFNESSDAWITDAFQKSLGSIPHFTENEEKEFDSSVDKINKLSSNIPWNYVKKYGNLFLMPFLNSYVVNNKLFPTLTSMYDDYIEFLNAKKIKEKESKKTEVSKNKVEEKFKDILDVDNNLSNLFEIYKLITELKLTIVRKVDKIKSTKTFLQKGNELVSTNDEGYVLTKTDANGCKLVDRLQFAHANFSSEFKKGWDH